MVLEQCPLGAGSFITISHCGGQERAELLAKELEHALDVQSIPVYEVPPAIVVHGGPGIISVSFFKSAA